MFDPEAKARRGDEPDTEAASPDAKGQDTPAKPAKARKKKTNEEA
jgi:hypothetical protein